LVTQENAQVLSSLGHGSLGMLNVQSFLSVCMSCIVDYYISEILIRQM